MTLLDSIPIYAIATATIRLSVFAILGLAVLQLLKAKMPGLHRCVWATVLLQAVILSPIVLSLPVLEPGQSNWQGVNEPLQNLVFETAEGGTLSQRAYDAAGVKQNESRVWLLVAAVIWVSGVVCVLTLLLASQIAIVRMIRQSATARDGWQLQLRSLVRQIGIRRPVRLGVHPRLGPLLAMTPSGYHIIVPREIWERLTFEQREAVLWHELTHLQRGDVWKSTLMRCVAAIHWFNPLTWWLLSKFDEAAEWACDSRVRDRGDRLATALASVLLQLSKPTPLVRLGASTARGARIGDRVRRLIHHRPKRENMLKTTVLLGFAVLIMLLAFFRVQLVAQDVDRPSRQYSPDIAEELRGALQGTNDPLAEELSRVLESQAGQLILQDRLSGRVAERDASLGSDPVQWFLDEHFSTNDNKAALKDAADPLRAELVAAGKRSLPDMNSLTETCRKIAGKLKGDDDATNLIRRFLNEDVGPAFLYVSVLQDRMRPGLGMFENSLGRILAMNASGKYYVTPDAREKVSQIVALSDPGEKLATRLHRELKVWSDELSDGDDFHARVKKAGADPLFAAMILSEQVFERHQLEAGMVNKVLMQLEGASLDTAQGLSIVPKAREDLSKVLEKYETLADRVDAVRESTSALRSQMGTDDELSSQFANMLATDIATAGLAGGTEMANATTDQLVMSVIGDAFEESTNGELRLTSDKDMRQKIEKNIQEAFRDMRLAKRRAAPARQLADKLDDTELAEALTSVGGLLTIKQHIERRSAESQRLAMKEWKEEIFEESDNGLEIRESARGQVTAFIAKVREMEKELGDNDF